MIKDLLDSINTKLTGMDMSEDIKTQLGSNLQQLNLQFSTLISSKQIQKKDLQKFKTEVDNHKAKLYDLTRIQSQLQYSKAEIDKLSKYRQNVLQQKKQKANEYINIINIHSQDHASKNAMAYKHIKDNLDFQSETQQNYDKIIKQWQFVKPILTGQIHNPNSLFNLSKPKKVQQKSKSIFDIDIKTKLT